MKDISVIQKIGIMGGTFNPIHNGHIQLAKCAYETLKLDKVLFMPSGNSYLKKNVLATEHRVAMTKAAIAEYPCFELSLEEANREGNTYTYDTLQRLTSAHPDAKYYFILGADSLLYIDKWVKPEVIFELCTLVCAVRNDSDMSVLRRKGDELEQKGAKIIYLNMDKIDISSTAIREGVRQGSDISAMVPETVLRYIKQEHLYEED
ncbi:MAG: nicotinate-nucleotide adenylyltransferase [Lachnospiraceae bacterium]|nr:nicotinate-nucleotide adenylyltransferase [Lachnospiraceae bacterium]